MTTFAAMCVVAVATVMMQAATAAETAKREPARGRDYLDHTVQIEEEDNVLRMVDTKYGVVCYRLTGGTALSCVKPGNLNIK